MWVRVALGDRSGAKCEWSRNRSDWQPVKLADGKAINTIDLPAGSDFGGVYCGENSACKVGSANPVWLFFGGGGNGVTYIDDIELVNDAIVWSTPPNPEPPPKSSDAINVELIRPRGRSYTATVPDTLDLAERAHLAVHGLTASLDPAMNYAPWGHVFFGNPKPCFMDRSGGPPNWGKIAESIIKRESCAAARKGWMPNRSRSKEWSIILRR